MLLNCYSISFYLSSVHCLFAPFLGLFICLSMLHKQWCCVAIVGQVKAIY
nr:MAG TPA: hypothetical protein [Caudoviricetes sp.]